MSLKDEIKNSIQTPQEVEKKRLEQTIQECEKEAEKVFEHIIYLLKEAATEGRYEIRNGKKAYKFILQ